jgi:hypothetical protein
VPGPVVGRAQELDLDRDREPLVERHAGRRLAVDHHAAVALGPLRGPGELLAGEAVFDAEPEVAELAVVEEVAEPAAELRVPVVGDGQDASDDPKRLAIVLSERVARDLDRPALEIAAVEQGVPAAGIGARIGGGSDRRCGREAEPRRGDAGGAPAVESEPAGAQKRRASR